MIPEQNQGGDGQGARIARAAEPEAYEPPVLRRLGSLSELTLGGTTGPSDGFGGAGAMGSI